MKLFSLVLALSVLAPSTLATLDAPSKTQSIRLPRATSSGVYSFDRTNFLKAEDEARARPSFFQSLLLSLGLASAPPATPSPLSPFLSYGGQNFVWPAPQGKIGKWVYIGEGVTRWEGELADDLPFASTTLIFCDYDGVLRTTTIQRGGPPDERRRPFTIKEELSSIREGLTRSREIYNDEVDHGRPHVGHRLGGPRCDINNPKPLDQDSASFAYSLPSYIGPGPPATSHSLPPPLHAPVTSVTPSSFHWVDIGEGVSRWEDSNSPIPPLRFVGGSVRSDVLLRFIDSQGKWRVITAKHGGGPPGQMRPVTAEDDLRSVHNEKTREKFFKDNNITIHPSAEEVHVDGQDSWRLPSPSPPPPVATPPIGFKYCDLDHQGPRDAPCPPKHVHRNLAYRLHSALQGLSTAEIYFVALVFGVGIGSLISILFKIARQLFVRHQACAARRAARASSPSSGPRAAASRSVFESPGQHRKDPHTTLASDDTLPTYEAVSTEEKV